MLSPDPSRQNGGMRPLAETRSFFAPRAATWEDRFAEDQPAYDAVVERLALGAGDWVLDAGCGTGRAVEPLRRAVGRDGHVMAIDATPEMLAEARRRGRGRLASLVIGDAAAPPLHGARPLDAVLAAGLLPHLDRPADALVAWRSISATGARLAVFHPISRDVLAARHNGVTSDDDVLAEGTLRHLLAAARWELDAVDDHPGRPYCAIAVARA